MLVNTSGICVAYNLFSVVLVWISLQRLHWSWISTAFWQHPFDGLYMCIYIPVYKDREWFTVKCVCLGVFMYIIAFVVLSNSLIFEKFSSGDPDTKDNSVGIQLLGIVLANNLPPFDPKCEIDHARWEMQFFVNNLEKNLSQRGQVYFVNRRYRSLFFGILCPIIPLLSPVRCNTFLATNCRPRLF